MTDTEFKRILTPKLRGAFLFAGEEDYLRHFYLEETRKKLLEPGDTFNHSILKGPEALGKLSDVLSQIPMFADVRLTEVHDVVFQDFKEEQLEPVLAAGEQAKQQGDCVLILFTSPSELKTETQKKNEPQKKNDASKKIPVFDRLSAVYMPVLFEKVTPGKLSAWAGRHFAGERIIAEPMQLDAIISRCGTSMTTLAGEIEKLCCYIHAQGRDRLTDEDIRLVSCENPELSAFALSNAVQDRRCADAFTALADMKAKHVEVPLALSGITRTCSELESVSELMERGLGNGEIAHMCGMHPTKVSILMRAVNNWGKERIRRAVCICADADRQVKRSLGYDAVERLLSSLFL